MSTVLTFNPSAAQLLRSFDTLPAVRNEQLSIAAIRERFQNPPSWSTEIIGDRPNIAATKDASVLIALLEAKHGLEVVLTKRTEHLSHHAGQISFPGGRRDDNDQSAQATALREAQEEVGIEPSHTEVLGLLPHYQTVTAFQVTPVVAHCKALGIINRYEVEQTILVPLSYLMNPANHQLREVKVAGQPRQFFAMPWQGHFIWGATAAMLRNFYRFLATE